MENEELKDILLDRDDDVKNAKLKKLLMFIAALVILFLVIIVAMKILNSGDSTQAQNDNDLRLALPPVPIDQPITNNQMAHQDNATASVAQPPLAKPEEKKNDGQLFEQVPIVPENKQQDDFEDMIKKLKDKENGKSVAKTDVKAKEPTASSALEQTKENRQVATAKPETKTDTTQESKSKSQQTVADTKPASTQSKSEPKTPVKPANKQNTSVAKGTASKGAYVQVFATGKFNPNAEYIKKIQTKGYSYHTLKVGEVTKILVGPFDDKNLQTALSDIRRDVNKDAFIFRVK
ncbi:MAG: hypothetical protein LUC34_08285 [Campylobacter sp.]|nr:hypothetical protein [Campylobacter sp.]